MALIVEDGTGVDDANALITEAFADDYFALRGNTTWSALDSAAKEIAIITATDYMELMFADRWKGSLSEDATTLSFPRVYMYNRKCEAIDFETDGIPLEIMKAVAEYAVRASSGPLVTDPTVTDASGQIVTKLRKKIGPLETETEFVAGTASTTRSFPAADGLLKQYLNPRTGSGGVYR